MGLSTGLKVNFGFSSYHLNINKINQIIIKLFESKSVLGKVCSGSVPKIQWIGRRFYYD